MAAGNWLVAGLMGLSRCGSTRKYNDRLHAEAEALRAKVLPEWVYVDPNGDVIEEDYEMTASEWAALEVIEDDAPTEPIPVIPTPAPFVEPAGVPLPMVAPAPEAKVAKPRPPRKARVHVDPPVEAPAETVRTSTPRTRKAATGVVKGGACERLGITFK